MLDDGVKIEDSRQSC